MCRKAVVLYHSLLLFASAFWFLNSFSLFVYFLKTVTTCSHVLRLLHFLYLSIIVIFYSLTVFQWPLERVLQSPVMAQLYFHLFFSFQAVIWIGQASPKPAVMLWTVSFWQSQLLLTHCSLLASLFLRVWGCFRNSQFPHIVFRRPKNVSIHCVE